CTTRSLLRPVGYW
nr:immunoglobulin heavy chain junction region [Mus musculus]